MSLLEIKDLHVEVGGREILKGVTMNLEEGETCVLFGPNGSGKSTLLSTIMGYGQTTVTSGKIIFKGEDITGMSVDQRAKLGIGMMMQRPPNVIGVKLGELVKVTAANGKGTTGRENEFNMQDFMERDVNVGFSGGEIKRSELLQLSAQSPDFVMLDEPESGVDLENIGLIGKKVHELIYGSEDGKTREKNVSAFVITHTGQIMDYIGADKAFVLIHGKIAREGDPRAILEDIKQNGYGVDDE
ncbi:ABC transporter ATP-binding protein [Methanomethylophilus alvi]|uniref:ABC transporter ATP-binding protein n=1 Tax=Methanomethylophilus alvi TaxID=1291540 RepID=UPI0037DC63D1